MRLRFLTLTLAAGFVLALAMGSAQIFGDAKAFAAETTITVLSGDVSVRHTGGVFAAAVDGDVLKDGDTVRTGDNGRAILTYFEGSSVTVEPSTELTIDAMSTASDGGTVVLMTQSFGRTWHVVTKLITGGSRYEVKTPASTASVRGTEFQVDTTSDATTITTTEGTVVQQVADATQPTNVTEVRVPAGTTQTQKKNAAPAPAGNAPQPDRKVTVHVGATNSLVLDPLGRANGFTRDGKLVVQTPGAQVKRDGGAIVVTLPNVPDGRVATRVAATSDDDDVSVTATVEEKGKGLDLSEVAHSLGANMKVTGFELARDRSGDTETRALSDDESKALPQPKVNPQRGNRAASTATATTSPSTARPVATPEFRTLTPRATQPAENGRGASSDDHDSVKPTKRVDTVRDLIGRLMPPLPGVSKSKP